MITKPMRGDAVEEDSVLKYPLYATPKLDGIRCVKLKKALSKTFKDIPNAFIQAKLTPLPSGLDGELILVKGAFNAVQSGIMSKDGEPNFEYAVFDYVSTSLTETYLDRVEKLKKLKLPSFCVKILPTRINNRQELDAYEQKCLDEGYEGIMIRSGHGPYKCGKSSVKQGIMMKVKRFKDSEAVVIGFEEMMHNENEKTEDEFGNSERSSHQENMVPAGTLGKFLVREVGDTPWKGKEFKIGTGKGFDHAYRQRVWDNQEGYLGKIITYKYQNHGIKELPRIPIWHGFRHKDDISED